MKKLAWVFALYCVSSWGGGSTGGGYGIVCEDALTKKSTVRLLDYYEAELLLPNLTLDLGNGKTETDLAENVVQRLKALDPGRAKDYRAKVQDFLSDMLFIKVPVPEIKDYGFAPIGEGCALKQIAVQNLIPIPEGKKFTINKPLWDQLSLTDKAGLILHEIIYEEALALGQKDSRNSRYFNALISSKEVEKLSAQDYLERLESVGLPEVQGGKPVASLSLPDVNIYATVGEAVNFDVSKYVLAPGGDPLSFSKVAGPMWLNVSSSGHLSGTPKSEYLGENIIQIEVSNGRIKSSGSLTVQVLRKVSKSLPTAVANQAYSYEFSNEWPFKTTCADQKVKLINSPNWLQSHAMISETRLAGTPTRADIGLFSVILELSQVCRRVVSGVDKSGAYTREVEEYQSVRQHYEGKVAPATEATGTPVSSSDFKEAVLLAMEAGGQCQATIVGPRVVLTAGHCARNGEKGRFYYDGVRYKAVFSRHANQDLDLALGLVSEDVVGAEPLNIGGKVTKGDKVKVLAYSIPAGNLNAFDHSIFSVNKYRIVHGAEKASIGFGNSGAPMITGKRTKSVAGIVVAGSIGAAVEEVFSENLTSKLAQEFFKKFAEDNSVDICGVTTLCD